METWKNKKILVAEDEMSNYMLLSNYLEDTEIQITHANNGKKATEFCRKEQFDVIFMDIKMPIMDGFEATAEIRKSDKDVPIIAQTAYAFKREECIESGFTDYISKPFNQFQLLQVIEKYLFEIECQS